MFIASVGVDAAEANHSQRVAVRKTSLRGQERPGENTGPDGKTLHWCGKRAGLTKDSSFTQGARVTESLLRTSSQPYKRLYERATSGRTRWTTRQK